MVVLIVKVSVLAPLVALRFVIRQSELVFDFLRAINDTLRVM